MGDLSYQAAFLCSCQGSEVKWRISENSAVEHKTWGQTLRYIDLYLQFGNDQALPGGSLVQKLGTAS